MELARKEMLAATGYASASLSMDDAAESGGSSVGSNQGSPADAEVSIIFLNLIPDNMEQSLKEGRGAPHRCHDSELSTFCPSQAEIDELRASIAEVRALLQQVRLGQSTTTATSTR